MLLPSPSSALFLIMLLGAAIHSSQTFPETLDPNAPEDKVVMLKRKFIFNGQLYANSNIMPDSRKSSKMSKRIISPFGIFGLGFGNPIAESIKMYLIQVRRKPGKNCVTPEKVFSDKEGKYYVAGSRAGFGMSHRIG